jgi:hypothetical protein
MARIDASEQKVMKLNLATAREYTQMLLPDELKSCMFRVAWPCKK